MGTPWQRFECAPAVVYALQVVNAVVAVPLIVEGGAAFGDNQSPRGVLAVNAHQDVGEAIGKDLRAHFSVGRARDALDGFVAICWHRAFGYGLGACTPPHEHSRVVVDAEEVDGDGRNVMNEALTCFPD
jgi:hypothetical protein